jgi:hypothetical protein
MKVDMIELKYRYFEELSQNTIGGSLGMKKVKQLLLLVLVVVLAIALTGCSKDGSGKEEGKGDDNAITADAPIADTDDSEDVKKGSPAEEGEASTSEATPDEMNESKSEVNITDMEPLSEDDFILTLVQYVGRVDPEMIMNFGEGDATKNGSAILAREYQREIFGKDMTWVANYDSKGCVEDFEVKLPDTDADKWAEAINKEVSEDEFVEGTTEWTVNNGKIVLEEKSGALTIKITAQ